MKVRIVKCSNSILWYNQHVGQVFDILWEEQNAYWTREMNVYGATNWIYKQDVEIVTEGDIVETN